MRSRSLAAWRPPAAETVSAMLLSKDLNSATRIGRDPPFGCLGQVPEHAADDLLVGVPGGRVACRGVAEVGPVRNGVLEVIHPLAPAVLAADVEAVPAVLLRGVQAAGLADHVGD